MRFFLMALALFLSACGGGDEPAGNAQSGNSAPVTPTPRPTASPTPRPTVAPTATPTPLPTPTPTPAPPDRDADGFADAVDNCPDWFDFYQQDSDGDGLGDRCDVRYDVDGKITVEPRYEALQEVNIHVALYKYPGTRDPYTMTEVRNLFLGNEQQLQPGLNDIFSKWSAGSMAIKVSIDPAWREYPWTREQFEAMYASERAGNAERDIEALFREEAAASGLNYDSVIFVGERERRQGQYVYARTSNCYAFLGFDFEDDLRIGDHSWLFFHREIGGSEIVSSCFRMRTIAHETSHLLGFEHEGVVQCPNSYVAPVSMLDLDYTVEEGTCSDLKYFEYNALSIMGRGVGPLHTGRRAYYGWAGVSGEVKPDLRQSTIFQLPFSEIATNDPRFIKIPLSGDDWPVQRSPVELGLEVSVIPGFVPGFNQLSYQNLRSGPYMNIRYSVDSVRFRNERIPADSYLVDFDFGGDTFLGSWGLGQTFRDPYRGVLVSLERQVDNETMEVRVSRSAARFDRHAVLLLEDQIGQDFNLWAGEDTVTLSSGSQPVSIRNPRIQSNITAGHSVLMTHNCPELLPANSSCAFTIRTERNVAEADFNRVFLLRMETDDPLMPQPVVEFRHARNFSRKGHHGHDDVVIE